ncbi:MAG: Rpp14/Pop5 family protein [Candidatus Asgardarchaeia archaeon]
MIRDKRRYIAFEVYSENNLSKEDIISLILNEFVKNFGEYEGAKASLYVVSYDNVERKGILKVNLNSFKRALTTLAAIRYFRKSDIRVKVIGVSGTIRKCKRKYLKKQSTS